MTGPTSTAKLMVTVKAYPQLSQRTGEVVCVAGVRVDTPTPQWIRLYPVNFRDLDEVKRFRKYDVIEVKVRRGPDHRPESFVPLQGSINVLESITTGRDQLWADRRERLGPLVGAITMCELLARNTGNARAAAPSLALIKPEVLDVIVEKNSGFDDQRALLANLAAQATLFSDAKAQLAPSPYVVKYRYRCRQTGCGEHTQSLIDWEVGEAGRQWSSKYDPGEVPDRIRAKFLDQLCGDDRDTHFYVGNTHRWLSTFLVLGVFWPKHKPHRSAEDNELTLF